MHAFAKHQANLIGWNKDGIFILEHSNDSIVQKKETRQMSNLHKSQIPFIKGGILLKFGDITFYFHLTMLKQPQSPIIIVQDSSFGSISTTTSNYPADMAF